MDPVKSDKIQRVFDQHGPERDRGTDWWRCTESPWRELAGILVYPGGR